MPLSRTEREPIRDPNTEGLMFVMLDSYLKVRCLVTAEGLNSLDGICLTTIEKITRYFEHQDVIEAAASRLYDAKEIGADGVVTITGRALQNTQRW